MASARHVWAAALGILTATSFGVVGCASNAPVGDGESATSTSEEAVTGAVGDWTGFTNGQCVHGVYQFFLNRYGISLLGTCAQAGNLGICQNCGACMIWESATINPPKSLFNKYTFGSTMPQTYDIVVYPPRGGVLGPGHVAAVDHMSAGAAADDWQHMYVMDTNWNDDEKMATAVHTVTRAPYGIFRLKSLDHAPPNGTLDVADCTSISGWAQDPEQKTTAVSADLSFNGPAGSANAVSVKVAAGTDRSDLCTAIGSCNHAYAFPTPRGAMDGTERSVYAYGVGASGNEALLGNKTFKCAAPAIPDGAKKRWVTSPTVLKAWAFQTFFDMATYPAATIDALADDTDIPATPSLAKADGSEDIWVLDGTERRHVGDPASLVAWRFDTTKIATLTAAALAGYSEGLAWPETPLLVKSTDDTKVYMLDGILPTSNDGGVPGRPGQAGGSTDNSEQGSSASNDDAANGGSSSGCSLSRASNDSNAIAWLFVPALGLVVARRRVKKD
ncbi:MAG TPA: CHAP domain-containing protein [Polyangiaceae bacterium]